ncbi:hypothetical protein LAZ67_6002999 [Cordylochernes scorpioides]|uniref:Uncharacterized protein n=1 Tax=Cordylochernes scorpioides TaxID=51811 RepID=A0ABY6KM39_9ARAC|nr:hypothetical protein LAZ67_6002999 [Cordylochernes scorpioides]
MRTLHQLARDKVSTFPVASKIVLVIPLKAACVPKRPSPILQANSEKLAKIGFDNDISRRYQEIYKNVNSPAGKGYVNFSAADAVSIKSPSNVAKDCLKDLGICDEGKEDGCILVKNINRSRDSVKPNDLTAQSNSARSSGTTGATPRNRTSVKWTPRVQEVKTTRAHITKARAWKASSTQEQCVYIKHCPEFTPYQYLKAHIIQLTRMNGHVLAGLTSKTLAERLIDEGLEIEGTTSGPSPSVKGRRNYYWKSPHLR